MSKIKFNPMPVINGRDGRFCPFCEYSVYKYFSSDKCPNAKCGKPLPKPPPAKLGYSWCDNCHSHLIHDNHSCCSLCGKRTAIGTERLKLINDFEKKQAKERKALKRKLFELEINITKKPKDDIDKLIGSINLSEVEKAFKELDSRANEGPNKGVGGKGEASPASNGPQGEGGVNEDSNDPHVEDMEN